LQRMLLDSEEEDARIFVSRKNILMKLGDLTFFSRLIDGEYIDYNRVIPKDCTIFAEVDRLAYISSLERASLVTEDKSLGQVKSHVKFDFEGDVLKVSSESLSGSVYDEVAMTKEGADLTIGFNCRYFLDALKSADSEKIKISMKTPLMSVVITSADTEKKENKSDYLYMVCPVRMN